jgi:hypothetical protein
MPSVLGGVPFLVQQTFDQLCPFVGRMGIEEFPQLVGSRDATDDIQENTATPGRIVDRFGRLDLKISPSVGDQFVDPGNLNWHRGLASRRWLAPR